MRLLCFLAFFSSVASLGTPADAVLAKVRDYHGGPGPWAVAGYRMGTVALRELGLRRHDFRLSVVHRSPDAVQFTCVLDGVHAATGASYGKRSLAFRPVAGADRTETCFTDRKTGRTVRIRLRAEIRERITDVPYAEHEATSRRLLDADEGAIFVVDGGRCDD